MSKAKIHNPLRVGNDYGQLKFGHININNHVAGVMLRNGPPAPAAEHYMQFMSTGTMAGGTINRCPGVYQIWCGNNPVTNVSFVLNAVDGDIIIRAPNGRIMMEAKNIDIRANGDSNKSGFVNIDANEKVIIRSKNIEFNASSVAKFFSSGLCEIVGKNTLNFAGGLIDCADGATSVRRSKGISNLENQEARDST